MKFIKDKNISIIILCIVLILSFFVLYTPMPTPSDDGTRFSAIRASEHIEVISREPHSYYEQYSLEKVKNYIENTLGNYLGGENVRIISYSVEDMQSAVYEDDREKVIYPVNNVLGKLPGKNDEGILLVAHYDSRGHVGRPGELGRSYGAMDDGYGVGSLLELAYIFKDTHPENSVYFLFTDAEEIGLFGAIMASKDKEVMKNIRFVINAESRGRYGASYMFETSKNNEKVIDLYKKALYPVSYSMAAAVYSLMPNFTDFTPFIDAGVPGLNFATLAGLENYHGPLDTYEYINQSSIEHMGVQLEPIIREFMSDKKYIDPDYFSAGSDKVFFTLFTNVFISYSETTAIILAILCTILFVVFIAYRIRTKTITKTVLTRDFPKGLFLTLILVVSGFVYSYLAAFLGKTPFNITYTRIKGADIPTLLFMLATVAVFVRAVLKSGNSDNVLIIGIGINTLLGLLTTFFLPGASFLFTVTSLMGLIVLSTNFIKNKYIGRILTVIPYAVLIFIIVPILYTFYMAITVGGVAVLVLLFVINATVLIPAIMKDFQIA